MAEESESADGHAVLACSSTVGAPVKRGADGRQSRVSTGACRVNVFRESDSRSLIIDEMPGEAHALRLRPGGLVGDGPGAEVLTILVG